MTAIVGMNAVVSKPLNFEQLFDLMEKEVPEGMGRGVTVSDSKNDIFEESKKSIKNRRMRFWKKALKPGP